MNIKYVENRGTENHPFGFVYFDDDTRVGYSPGIEEEVWPFEGPHWNKATSVHVWLARKYLQSIGIKFGKKK